MGTGSFCCVSLNSTLALHSAKMKQKRSCPGIQLSKRMDLPLVGKGHMDADLW